MVCCLATWLRDSGDRSVSRRVAKYTTFLTIGRSKEYRLIGQRWRDFELLAIAEKLMEVIGEIKHPSQYGSGI